MFFDEIVLNLSLDQHGHFHWEYISGVPLMCLIAITEILRVIEMVIHSRMAYQDPSTMLLGKITEGK